MSTKMVRRIIVNNNLHDFSSRQSNEIQRASSEILKNTQPKKSEVAYVNSHFRSNQYREKSNSSFAHFKGITRERDLINNKLHE